MSWLSEQAQILAALLGFLGLPAAIGYVLPARWDPWAILCVAIVIAAAWGLYDGSFHNDPWPLVITPAGLGFFSGIIMR